MPAERSHPCASLVVLLCSTLAACGPTVVTGPERTATPAEIPIARATAETDGVSRADTEPAIDDDRDPGPVPVTRADPSWGSSSAPVTIVEFADLQCPFCLRAAATLEDLRRSHGADRLRIVWKNNPLPFHREARGAAETIMAIFAARGPSAFWAYHDAVYQVRTGAPPKPLDATLYDGALVEAGVAPADLRRMLAGGEAARKVDADLELAKNIGATGTPNFFINGVRLSGAQPVDKFNEVIDAQVVEAERLVREGVPRGRVYAELCKRNFRAAAAPSPAASPSSAAADDRTVYRVPIDGAPLRGKSSALVTVVVFADFQCPFSMRVQPTLKAIAQQYGDRVRFVWRNQPLPFHPRAEPAAEVALDVRAQRGDAAFWKAHDLLFARGGKLEDADLIDVASAAGADPQRALTAAATGRYASAIKADQQLAESLRASGTPHFFVNGRRLVGAQPLERFRAVVDEEIAAAQALVKRGTPATRVYETIQKNAVQPAATKTTPLAPATRQGP